MINSVRWFSYRSFIPLPFVLRERVGRVAERDELPTTLPSIANWCGFRIRRKLIKEAMISLCLDRQMDVLSRVRARVTASWCGVDCGE